jgi:hypothetical protein
MNSEHIESIVDLAATIAARAEEIDKILIIYTLKPEKDDESQFSLDNGLTLEQSSWMVNGFLFWLHAGAMGLLKRIVE